MKRLSLLLVFLLAMCGPAPDFVTKHGAEFYNHGLDTGFTQEIADEHEDWAIWVFMSNYGITFAEVETCLDGLEVHFEGNYSCPWYTFGTVPGCFGYYDGLSDYIKLGTFACPWVIPYHHEILHKLQWCVSGTIDSDHSERVWEQASYVDTYLGYYRCHYSRWPW